MDFKSLCDQIDKSRKPIKFYLVKRGNKKLTVIQGLDDPNYQLKLYKRKYACNGFLELDNINLQGDHLEAISKDLGTLRHIS